MNIIRIPVHFLLSIALTMLSCSMQPLTGGSDLPNGIRITGTVRDINGAGSPQAEVRLIPSDYDPVGDQPLPKSFSTTTDIRGNYTLRATEAGVYNILAIQGEPGTRALLLSVALSGDAVTAPQATLLEPGEIKVAISDRAGGNGYWYIPGTTIASFIDDNGFAILDSVPAGKIPGVYYRIKGSSTAPVKIADSISVPSGGAFTVAYPVWKFSEKLFLNTSVSGADIPADVTGFPVLVRLNSGNFSFNQARPGGADLRFTKSNGTPLPYEIERWDGVSQRAEIWVKADTVYGNDEGQNIIMYWGADSSFSSQSNGQAVFDTADGFQGIWHLSQPTAVLTKDATANRYDGTPTGVPPVAVEGAIGIAQKFDGAKSYFTMLNSAKSRLDFAENGRYSVSTWVNADTLDSLFHAIVFKSNFQYGLQIRPENCWEFMSKTSAQWEGTIYPAAANSWHALTGVRNGARQYLYVDGVCVDSGIGTIANTTARTYDIDLQIGHCSDGLYDLDRYFKGKIDEVRVENVALSADRIKLSYMNQRLPDLLVQIIKK